MSPFSFLKSKIPPKLQTLLNLCLSILVSILLTPVIVTFALVMTSLRAILSLYFRITTHSKVRLIQSMDSFQVWDKPNNLLETYTVLILEGNGDLGKVRKTFTEKVIQNEDGLYTKLTSRVVKRFGFYCWELLDKSQFRVEDHIKVVDENTGSFLGSISGGLNNNRMEAQISEGEGFGEKQLLEKVSGFYGDPMLIDKPRWEVWVIPKFNYGDKGQSYEYDQEEKPHYALILRVHHSIMDGISTYLLLSRVLADLDPGSSSTLTPFSSPASSNMAIDPLKTPDNVSLTWKLWNYFKMLLVWPILLHQNVASPPESNAFHGGVPLGRKKIVKWTDHFRIETLKKIRKSGQNAGVNLTTNAVLNAAVGGSFLRFAQAKGSSIPDQVTAVTSIPMLPYPDLKPRNRFSGAFFPLLVGGGENRLERLKVTDNTLREITASPLILFNSIVLRFIGILPAVWSQNMTDSRELTVLTSNIPGPNVAEYFFGGDKLVDVAGFLPIKNKTGFGFCFVSYCGNIRAAVVADATVVSEQDVEILVKSFLDEISQMERDAEWQNHDQNVEIDGGWVELGFEV